MATSIDNTVRTILKRTPANENPNDSMVLVGTLTLAYLAFPRWQLDDAVAFERAAELAGTIWCLLTDVTKTHAYIDGMRRARRSYEGISTNLNLQLALRQQLHDLLVDGELQSIEQAVRNKVYDRMGSGLLS